MKSFTSLAAASGFALIASSAFAQQPAPPAAPAAPTQPQSPDMTFFVTGSGLGKGADLGGIEGADAYCQRLATGAGAGAKTWRAYLSTQPADGKPAINARDRIGKGPWQNFRGVAVATSVDDLHGAGNKMGMEVSLTERGLKLPGVGWAPNVHDVLTGSTMEGRAFPAGEDRTCGNWTSSAKGSAMLGHIDRTGLSDTVEARSWNAAHPSRGADGGCSQNDLRSTGGARLLYCFAAN